MPPVRLLTSSSPRRLERALLEAVREAAAAGSRVAVVVPTRILADRLRREMATLAGEDDVVAGVEILHHRALADAPLGLAWLRGCRPPPPRLASHLEPGQ